MRSIDLVVGIAGTGNRASYCLDSDGDDVVSDEGIGCVDGAVGGALGGEG